MTVPSAIGPRGVDHYENFPVASWLCPPALRPAVVAIYGFARTADDIADEGDADPATRLALLAQYGADLRACAAGRGAGSGWPQVFGPLAAAIERHALPVSLLADLLSAFTQDVEHTRDGRGYADRADLADYCRRSANPVGRLLLHLYGRATPQALAESDRVCTALQLINFWQDLSIDLPRGRRYLPDADLIAHGMDPGMPTQWPAHPGAPALVRSLAGWSRELMQAGSPIVHRVPGRAGWELRAVVQGGLRILDKVERLGSGAFSRRPRIGTADAPLMLWRCLRMKQSRP